MPENIDESLAARPLEVCRRWHDRAHILRGDDERRRQQDGLRAAGTPDHTIVRHMDRKEAICLLQPWLGSGRSMTKFVRRTSGPSPERARERARFGEPDQVRDFADAQVTIVEVHAGEARADLLSDILEPQPFQP